ncbi:MAG: hypothetical protein ACRDID_22870 [Ktedonobacterales bacterium]
MRFARLPHVLIAVSTLSLLAIALSGCGALQAIGASNTEYLPTNLARATPSAATYQSCPPEGQGGDPALNALYNRQDDNPPGGYRVTDIATVMAVPTTPQVSGKNRSAWPSADAKRVALYEGAAIRTTGWVVAARKGGPSPANCNSDTNRDWYLWIGAGAGDALDTTLLVVVTPRVQVSRPGWTDYTMRRLVGQVVRVSGYLVYDQEPPQFTVDQRATAWELQPVMHLETLYQNQWINLDLFPFGTRVAGTPSVPATIPTATTAP